MIRRTCEYERLLIDKRSESREPEKSVSIWGNVDVSRIPPQVSDFVGSTDSTTTHEFTPGVVSHTPSFPGSLYRICTPAGEVIVVTLVAAAGSCRFGSFRNASEPSKNPERTAIETRI